MAGQIELSGICSWVRCFRRRACRLFGSLQRPLTSRTLSHRTIDLLCRTRRHGCADARCIAQDFIADLPEVRRDDGSAHGL